MRTWRGYATHRTPLQRLPTLRCSLLYLRTYSVCCYVRSQEDFPLPSGVTAFFIWVLPHRKVLIAAKSFAVITNTFIGVRYLSPEKLWKSPLRVFGVHQYPPFLLRRYTFPARRTVSVFKAKNYIMIHYLRISFPRTLTYLFDRIVLQNNTNLMPIRDIFLLDTGTQALQRSQQCGRPGGQRGVRGAGARNYT